MEIELTGGRKLHHCNMANLVQYDDKKKATALSLWQRFLDLFRISPKKDILDSLYENINEYPAAKLGGAVYYRFYNFEKLKALALPAYRNLFKVGVQSLGMNGTRYTFSIDKVDIYSFDTPNNWDSLSELSFNQLPLVENYNLIVKNFAADNDVEFTKKFPDTKIKDNYGGDEVMDYSCFFLERNPDIKLTLLEYGLFDLNITNAFVNDMEAQLKGDDDRIGKINYRLITLQVSLNYLESRDCMA
ncbi:hypothetical protein [Candidatus Symbiopectobacterium sp. NZEC135]|uniref:hypothetical protein n=1 Tax=Candidatus Symbiopectobacterium sp. NZEC135 TaxID=2820471 RepID=UPI0022280004|nr:hypothetical protein [Candidatus Symbiopectobacterium sp. NZEC135]MCW2478611.1 hypothetical protein [Candidatus Symbiopectobacterium sp. NZEC135]